MEEKIELTSAQKEKVVANAESKIINMLLSIPSNRISDGYYGWHVSRYKGFIWQFASLNQLEKEYLDEACDSLLKKNFIKVGEGKERKNIFIELKKQYFASQI